MLQLLVEFKLINKWFEWYYTLRKLALLDFSRFLTSCILFQVLKTVVFKGVCVDFVIMSSNILTLAFLVEVVGVFKFLGQ